MLRPAWPEDAPALARAIDDAAVVRNLANAPWPYSLADAHAFVAAPGDRLLPALLLFKRTAAAPRLIGCCALRRQNAPRTAVLGYWIEREQWGRGYATEAALHMVEIARTIGLERVEASYCVDNPASGRVLEKLGFTATGIRARQFSAGRGCAVETIEMRRDLNRRPPAKGALAA